MTTLAIRKKLADFMKVADESKVKAMYALLKEDIEQEEQVDSGYSEDFKKELDQCYAYYKSGGKMVTPEEADKQINTILQGRNN